MVETLTNDIIEKETTNQMEFMNAFGIVFEKHFVVFDNNKKIKINMSEAKHVNMRKSRIMTKNIFLIAIAVYTLIFSYYLDIALVYKIIFETLALFLLTLGMLYKEYQYKFIIVKLNECITFIVKEHLKEDAKKIQRVLAEKLHKG
ncbi:hypothetical protein [Flavobacterium luteum]|uniref:Uncharacterized protein n=1 Tax=Flavobacterium luteum TaxID=2026654 RepID=A0A7J5A9V8_9FLAO|nr:hypothetical protein [Flavobacterium luteum]KAB1154295.1 hypothetical protein F6464_12995 [Flavobacterium luteum]